MSDSIKVAIKVRPLIKREKDENLPVQWEVQDNVIVPLDVELKKRLDGGFKFDHIFDPEKANKNVFNTVVKPIVESAVNGFNGTVFAYGQTSSGKTHTMMGTANEPGIIPLAVEYMFDAIANTSGREFLLRVSYLEIYNEKVNDLLEPIKKDLKLREDNNGLVQVLDCKEEVTNGPEIILEIMKRGDKNRRTGQTDMNERSSRSHTIFRITIESREASSEADGAIQVSQLNLVDLAGSERASQTNATGERFKEGTHINLSLSTLGLVIKQLSEAAGSEKYVNFRDSKLTRLLQASLGGNAMTVMICAVTPASVDETQCTLSFASRAKSVKNKPQLNEVMSDAALLKRYKKQLAKLNTELENLKAGKRLTRFEQLENELQQKEHTLKEQERINQLLEERIQLLKNTIVSGDKSVKEDSSINLPAAKRRRTWAGDCASQIRACSLKNLPTIEEGYINSFNNKSEEEDTLADMTFMKPKSKRNTRQSIIEYDSSDLRNQSFETELEDFELELIRNAKERDSIYGGFGLQEGRRARNKLIYEPKVRFQNPEKSYGLGRTTPNNLTSTPQQKPNSQRTDRGGSESPGTPKSILRERMNRLHEEYLSLQEFTTLEKQLWMEEKSAEEHKAMRREIDDLSNRLMKLEFYRGFVKKSINSLVTYFPKVFDSWQPSHLNDSSAQDDEIIGDLEKLEELLVNFELDKITEEKQMASEYSECLKRLDDMTAERDSLLKENLQTKEKLTQESEKLKALQATCKNITRDSEELMDKLLKKDSEISKLRERVVNLERMSPEPENTSFESQIAKLNDIINEKTQEIDRFKALESVREQNYEEEISKCKDRENELRHRIEDFEVKLEEQKIHVQNTQASIELEQIFNETEETSCRIIERSKAEIERLKQEEDDWTNKIGGLQNSFRVSEVPEKLEKIENLDKVKIEKLVEEVTNLMEVSDKASKMENNLLQKTKEESKEIQSLKASLEVKTNEIQTLHHEISESKNALEREKAKLEERLDCLNVKISDLERENQDLRKTVGEESAELRKLRELAEKSNNEIQISESEKILNARISDLENLKQQMELENINLQKLVEEKSAEIFNLNQAAGSDILNLRNSKEQLITENNDLRRILEEKSAEIQLYEELKDSKNALNSRISDLEKIKEQLELENSKLQEIVEEKSVEVQKLEGLKENFNHILESEKTLNVKILDLEKLKEQLELEKDDLRKIVEEKSVEVQKLAELEESMNQISESKNILDVKVSDLEKLKEQLELENDDLRRIVEEKSTEAQKLEELNVKFNNVLESENNLKARILDLERENNDLRQEVEKLNSTLQSDNSLNARIVDLERENNDLRQEIQKFEELEERFRGVLESENQLKARILELEGENQNLKALEQKFNDLLESEKSLHAKILSLERQNQELEEFSESENTLKTRISDLEKENQKIKEFESQILDLEQQIQSYVDLKERLIGEVEILKAANNEAIINSENLHRQIKDLQDSLDIVTESEQHLAKTADEKNSEIRKYKKNEAKLLEEIEKLKSAKNLTIINEENTNEILTDDLKSELDKKNQVISEFEKMEKIFRDEIESLKQDLIQSQNALAQMSFTEEIRINAHEMEEEISRLKLKIEEFNEKPTDFLGSLLNMRDHVMALKSETLVINDFEVKNIEGLKAKLESLIQVFQKDDTVLETSSILTNESYFSNLELQASESIEEVSLNISCVRTPLKSLQNSAIINNKLQKKCAESPTTANSTLNQSINMSEIEEKLTTLHSEVKELKENQNSLANQYRSIDGNVSLQDWQKQVLNDSVVRNSGKKASKIRRVEKSLEDLANDLQTLRKKSQDMSVQMQKLLANRSDAEVENEELRNKLRDAFVNRENSEEEVKVLNKKLEELIKDNEELKSQLEGLFSEKTNLELNLENLTQDKSKLELDLNQKLELESEHEKLKIQFDDLKLKIETLESEKNMENEHKELRIQFEDLKLREESLAEEKTNLELKLNALTEEKIALESSLSQKLELEKEFEDLKLKLESLAAEKTDLELNLNNLIAEKTKLEELTKDSEEKLKLENEHEELKIQFEELKLSLDSLTNEKTSLESVLNQKLNLESEHEELKLRLDNLTKEKTDLEMEKIQLEQDLKSLTSDNDELKIKLDSLTSEKLELENSSKTGIADLENQLEENARRRLEMESEIESLREKLTSIDRSEFDSAKNYLLKEIKGFRMYSDQEYEKLIEKPLAEICESFVKLIQKMQMQVVDKLNSNFEKVKKKLVEEKQQAVDKEARSQKWVETVEADLEKMQKDLVKTEQSCKQLKDQLNIKEENLKEAYHENQQLRETVTGLEAEAKSLHSELEKKIKAKEALEASSHIKQEKETLSKSKELELQAQFNSEKEELLKEISELRSKLEEHMAANDELKNTVEGLELEAEHMTKTMEIKNSEIEANNRKIEQLKKEIELQIDVQHQLQIEIDEKAKRIEEIQVHMKLKCDLLTEYKTKVETMTPEYESLEAQISSGKQSIEKYKEDINNLKQEMTKLNQTMEDKILEERMKSTGLQKTISDLKNTNTALNGTIEEMRDRCNDLESMIDGLQTKLKNATTNDKLETELQNLREENRSLTNQLEGSYNRAKELLDAKTKAQQEVIDLQTNNGLIEQELANAKISVNSLREKLNAANSQKLRANYEALVEEKKSVVMELEEKKMLLASKEQQISECTMELEQLNQKNLQLEKKATKSVKEIQMLKDEVSARTIEIEKLKKQINDSSFILQDNKGFKILMEEKNKIEKEKQKLADELRKKDMEKEELAKKNKDLDEELEEICDHVRQQANEIDELRDKLITGGDPKMFEKMKNLEDENETLKREIRVVDGSRRKLEEDIIRLSTEKEALNQKIRDLEGKITDLESKFNSSRNSSRSNSPTAQRDRRRYRRSGLFNQNRPNLDDADKTEMDSRSPTPGDDCNRCGDLREKIQELTLEIVDKNSKISILESSLQNKNHPFQVKCKELQDKLVSYKARNADLKDELRKLQETGSKDCAVCKHRKNNRREQGVQCSKEKIGLDGMSSGLVENHLKLEKMQKERDWMKDLCRGRARKIKELENRIKELEGVSDGVTL